MLRILMYTPTGKRPRHIWEGNIRMDVKEIGINMQNWDDSAQYRDCGIEPLGSISYLYLHCVAGSENTRVCAYRYKTVEQLSIRNADDDESSEDYGAADIHVSDTDVEEKNL